MIAKKIDIESEDLLFMILQLYNSAVSCFGIKVIAKNMALFKICIFFEILVLLNQKKVITLSYQYH